MFTYSVCSSEIPMGKITIEDSRLILTDEVIQKEYIFLIDGDALIFEADESAEVPRLDENTVTDGARFIRSED